MNHLQKLSDTYFANTKVGQIMSRITSDLFDVTEFAHHCPEEFFIAGLKALVAFVILAQTNLWLTLIVFVCLPVMIFCCTRFNHKLRQMFAAQRRQIGELNARMEDTLLGERVVKAFSGEDTERAKFAEDNELFLDLKSKGYRVMAAFSTTIGSFLRLPYQSRWFQVALHRRMMPLPTAPEMLAGFVTSQVLPMVSTLAPSGM